MTTKILTLILIIAVILTAISFLILKNSEKEGILLNGDAGSRYKYANNLLKEGETGQAIVNFNMVITDFPGTDYYDKALKDLAILYIRLGEYDKGGKYLKMLKQNTGAVIGEEKPAVKVSDDVGEEEPGNSEAPGAKDDNPVAAVVGHQSVTEKSGDGVVSDKVMAKEGENGFIKYVVVPGDSLYKIARKFNTTVERIKKINNLSSDVIMVDKVLKVDTAVYSVFVDKSDNLLILKRNGKSYKRYTVSTGKNNSTPVGEFTIVGKMIKPAWTKPGVGIIMPDDEEYELGERWIPISVPGYGIHGTNDETSIGGQVTSGCVRMHNSDVVELYDFIVQGDKVEIVD